MTFNAVAFAGPSLSTVKTFSALNSVTESNNQPQLQQYILDS